jgi:DNA-binding GntR family transcriptional regulator
MRPDGIIRFRGLLNNPRVFPMNASTHEQLVVALRRLVLDGGLPPGSPLREVALAEAFGVSRNTVRDAIRALGHEGLVRQDRHRSATVATLIESDAEDLYRVRRLLERSAMDHLDRLTAEQSAAVDAAFERLAKVARLREWGQVIESDLAFHRSLVAIHGSPRLLRAFDAIRSESAFVMSLLRLHEHEDEDPERVIAEHAAIRNAVLTHDASGARALLAGHLAYYEERAREILRSRAVAVSAPAPRSP